MYDQQTPREPNTFREPSAHGRIAVLDHQQPLPSARVPDARVTVPVVSLGIGLSTRGELGYAADRAIPRRESLRLEPPGMLTNSCVV